MKAAYELGFAGCLVTDEVDGGLPDHFHLVQLFADVVESLGRIPCELRLVQIWAGHSKRRSAFSVGVFALSKKECSQPIQRSTFLSHKPTIPRQLDDLHVVCNEMRRPQADNPSYTDLLGDSMAGRVGVGQAEHLQTSTLAKDDLYLQLNTMLGVAEIESSSFYVVECTTDVATICEDLFAPMIPRYEREDILWKTSWSSVTTETDPDRLRLALAQALDNTLRFTPKSGYVSLRVNNYSDSFQISIWNSGPKLPTQELDRISERSYQFRPKAHPASPRASALVSRSADPILRPW